MSHSQGIYTRLQRCENVNSPMEDSGIVAEQPSGYVSGSSATCAGYTKLATRSTYAVGAPEIEGQIKSANSTKSGLRGSGSKRAEMRGGNTQQPT